MESIIYFFSVYLQTILKLFAKYNMHDVNVVVGQMQSSSQITEAIKNVNSQVAELKLKSSLFDFFAACSRSLSLFFSLVDCQQATLLLMKLPKLDLNRFEPELERIGYLSSATRKIRCRLFIILLESFPIYKWFRVGRSIFFLC